MTEEPVKLGESDEKKIDKYEVENALSTILKAEEFKRNAPLMEEVKKLAAAQHKDLGQIALEKSGPKKPKDLKEMRQMADEMED